jgi:hypothetical protein
MRLEDPDTGAVSAREREADAAEHRSFLDLAAPVGIHPAASSAGASRAIGTTPGRWPDDVADARQEQPDTHLPSPPAAWRSVMRGIAGASRRVPARLASAVAAGWRACLAPDAPLLLLAILAKAAGALGPAMASRLVVLLAGTWRFALRRARHASGRAAAGHAFDAARAFAARLLQARATHGQGAAAEPGRRWDPRAPVSDGPDPGAVERRLGRLAAAWPPDRAMMGLAAASILLLLVAFGVGESIRTGSAALTFPIPARPAEAPVTEDLLVPRPLEAGQAAGRPPGTSALPDPIRTMIDHVSRPRTAPALPREESPLLASLGPRQGLRQFVRAARTVGLGELLQAGRSYTLFVPNDGAFAKLDPGKVDQLLEPSGHERLLALLSHHIVPQRLTYDDLAGHAGDYRSLAGQPLAIDARNLVRIGDAGLVQADLQVGGSVVHVIDSVLALPSP